MSFAAVESRYGPRIVGVGGTLITTIYDPKASTEIPGPFLTRPKLRPILIPRGSKLYALSRSPSVVPGLDFVPCGWRRLPPPPIFPVRLNPLEYRDPPEVRVASYAVVAREGHLRFRHGLQRVDDNNLPFIGQALPLGGHLFVARSEANGGAAAVYSIRVFPPTSSGTHKTELSILEMPVVSKGIVPGQLFCSLGKGAFSSIDVRSATPGPEAKLHKARIVHRTYSQVGGDDTAQRWRGGDMDGGGGDPGGRVQQDQPDATLAGNKRKAPSPAGGGGVEAKKRTRKSAIGSGLGSRSGGGRGRRREQDGKKRVHAVSRGDLFEVVTLDAFDINVN
ncbi:hypothetical protein E2562_023354 [Oryza meyeriana var. granulata]|uniref:Uncharacterized protein n=1 Tax=Oryza meyeriana var. granulata TaxID=110450 RepID=A0A6G1E1B1_9ORYZ|nr:hypothetical protein E2562_023354 [Oryza meyeriana var. granulata]